MSHQKCNLCCGGAGEYRCHACTVINLQRELAEAQTKLAEQSKATAAEREKRESEWAEAEVTEAANELMDNIIRRAAIAMKGPEAPQKGHSWHDLPEVAEALVRENAALREALQNLHDEIVDCDDALGLDSIDMRTRTPLEQFAKPPPARNSE